MFQRGFGYESTKLAVLSKNGNETVELSNVSFHGMRFNTMRWLKVLYRGRKKLKPL